VFKRLFKRRGARANKPRERPDNPLVCYQLLVDEATLFLHRLEERPFDANLYLLSVRLPFEHIEVLLERIARLIHLQKTSRPFSFTDIMFEPVTKRMDRWLEGKNQHYLPIQETFLQVAKISRDWGLIMVDKTYQNENHNNHRLAFDLAWELYVDITSLNHL